MSAIFISHSSKDNEVAAEVRARLEAQGHRSVFLDFDPAEGIPSGRDWEKELYAQLRGCRAVIVLCSEHSMASDWCFAEITHAKSLGKHVFPIKVAPCNLRSVLTDVQVIDLTSDREDGYQRLSRGLLIAGLDPRNFFDWDGSRPPYPGLMAFQEEDAAIFFGRDADIQNGLDGLNRLQRFGGARVVLVLGASGSGKSSLVRAGLVPRLKRDVDRWLLVDPFRPLNRPLQELALALSSTFARYKAPRDWEAICDALRDAAEQPDLDGCPLLDLVETLRIASGKREATVVLVIDQVEELLGYTPEDRASGFLSFVRAAVETPHSPLMVLGTLRSDFLGNFQGHPALREMPFESLPVRHLSADGFAQVIEGPAEVAGLELEAGLVQAMVDDTGTNDALPLLAFSLRELYERYGTDRRLEVREYRELGGLEGSVARAAQAVMAAQPLSREEQDDLRSAFVSMVRINEEGQYARRPAQWGSLPQRSHALLERFVATRLLVSSSNEHSRLLEVAHEALFRAWQQLKNWLEEDRDSIRLRDGIQRAAQEWDAGGREPQLLFHRQARLDAAEALARQPRFEFDAVARDYVQACVDVREAERAAERQREQARRRRLKWTISGLGLGLSIVSLLGVLVWNQRNEAVTARDEANIARDEAKASERKARSQYLAISARDSLRSQPSGHVFSHDSETFLDLESPFKQAYEAWQLEQSPLTYSVLVEVVSRFVSDYEYAKLNNYSAPSTMVRGSLWKVDWRPDGRAFVTSGYPSLAIWSLVSDEWLTLQMDGAALPSRGSQVAWSPDGQHIVSWGGSGASILRPDERLIKKLDRAVWNIAWSPHGERLATAGGGLGVWAADGTFLRQLEPTQQDTRIVAWSPDGAHLLTGSYDGTVRIWTDDGRGQSAFRKQTEVKAHPIQPDQGVWSPDSKRFVTRGFQDSKATIRTLDGEEVATLDHAPSYPILLAWSPTGERILTLAAALGTAYAHPLEIRLWSPDGKLLASPKGHSADISGAAWSPSGDRFLTWSKDKTVRLWSADGDEVGVLSGHGAAINSAAWNPDGNLVVTVAGSFVEQGLNDASDVNPELRLWPLGIEDVLALGERWMKRIKSKEWMAIQEESRQCPWVYMRQEGRWDRRVEIIQNLKGKDREATQLVRLGRVTPEIDGEIIIQIREELEEVSYLNRVQLKFEGSTRLIQPDTASRDLPAILGVDQKYLILKKGDSVELVFRNEEFRAGADHQLEILATGYYEAIPRGGTDGAQRSTK